MGANRAKVWAKTNGICWYCGKAMNPFDDFEEEHQDPRSQGGADELDNLQPSCKRCNRRKHGRTVEEYRESLAGKGELRFWGEISIDDEKPIDEDAADPFTLQEYNQIVKDCLYLGIHEKRGLDDILLVLTQMPHYWSLYPTADGKGYRVGCGDFTLAKIASILRLPKDEVFLSLLHLNKLGILKSPSYKVANGNLIFHLDTLTLHNKAMELLGL